MKFKSALLLFAIMCCTAFTAISCSSDDTETTETGQNIEFAELPVGAQNLLMDKYEESDISAILRSAEGYNVSVRKVKIDFDKNGEWKKIKSKDNLALPDDILTLVPSSIISYINDFYSNRGILEIERKKEKYEVELTGKPEIELEFDLIGNMTGDIKTTFAYLPENIQTFIKTHFDVESIKEIEKKSKKYQIEFKDKTEIEFDLDGNWTEVKTPDNKSVPSSIIALLPEKFTSYISEFYPNKNIYQVENRENRYEVKLGNGTELSFDKGSNDINENQDNNGENENGNNNEDGDDDNDSENGNVGLTALPQPAQDLLTKYYTNIAADYVKKEGNRYFVRLIDGTKFEFLTTGEVSLIVAPYTGSIPTDALMPAIGNYIKKNYAGKKVFKYVKQGNEGYLVQFSGYPVVKAFFNANGGFIRQF